MIVWKLNQVMAQKRITGKQLAEALNTHVNTVYRLRRADRMPSVDGELLDKLCQSLNCTPTDLIEYRPENGGKSLQQQPSMKSKRAKALNNQAHITAAEVNSLAEQIVSLAAPMISQVAQKAVDNYLSSNSNGHKRSSTGKDEDVTIHTPPLKVQENIGYAEEHDKTG